MTTKIETTEGDFGGDVYVCPACEEPDSLRATLEVTFGGVPIAPDDWDYLEGDHSDTVLVGLRCTECNGTFQPPFDFNDEVPPGAPSGVS